MVTGRYVPSAGDLVWLTFDPQAGHEQAGRRPALVLSPRVYNDAARLAIVCPVTTRAKGYPFEVRLPAACGVEGVVLADHVKSIDWQARRAEVAGVVPADVLVEVAERLRPLLSL